jgi:hypothetical protein
MRLRSVSAGSGSRGCPRTPPGSSGRCGRPARARASSGAGRGLWRPSANEPIDPALDLRRSAFYDRDEAALQAVVRRFLVTAPPAEGVGQYLLERVATRVPSASSTTTSSQPNSRRTWRHAPHGKQGEAWGCRRRPIRSRVFASVGDHTGRGVCARRRYPTRRRRSRRYSPRIRLRLASRSRRLPESCCKEHTALFEAARAALMASCEVHRGLYRRVAVSRRRPRIPKTSCLQELENGDREEGPRMAPAATW